MTIVKYDPDWTLHVLEDLAAFFEENQMPMSRCKIKEAMGVIEKEIIEGHKNESMMAVKNPRHL